MQLKKKSHAKVYFYDYRQEKQIPWLFHSYAITLRFDGILWVSCTHHEPTYIHKKKGPVTSIIWYIPSEKKQKKTN